ncbi:MAG: hypothetical protein AAB214_02275 [Fibrobacterota bacterium]
MRIITTERQRPAASERPVLQPMEEVNFLMSLCLEWTRKDLPDGSRGSGLQRSVVRISRR